MRKNNQKSLISVHFVCVQAAGSLGCSLATTTSLQFTFRSRGFPNSFYTWLTFSKISQVSPEDPILTQLCLQSPFGRVYLCILFSLKYASYLEFWL